MPLLQTLLATLSPAETRRAAHWLANPVHNQRRDLTDLYHHYSQGTPAPPITNPARRRAQDHHLLSRLEDFLVHDQLRRRPASYRALLLEAYRERRLDNHHAQRTRRYLADPLPGEDGLRLHYLAEQHLEAGDTQRQTPSNTGDAPAWADYLLYLQLRRACQYHSRQNFSTAEATTDAEFARQLPPLLRAAAQHPRPEIHAYGLALRLQTTPPDETRPPFSALIGLLTDEGIKLAAPDRRALLLLALNHGLKRINLGFPEATTITLGLYRHGLTDGSLLDRGSLSPFAFNNIVAIALHQGKTDWASHFIEQHAHRLPEEPRAEIVPLARARLAFATHDDGTALQYLQQSDFRDFIHLMTARVLQLKIYFRAGNFRLLSAHLSSTTRLLSRRKATTGYHHANYVNVFRLARRVVSLPPGERTAVAQLAAEIETTEPCTERKWLLGLLNP